MGHYADIRIMPHRNAYSIRGINCIRLLPVWFSGVSPAATVFVISVISNILLAPIGPTEITDSTKYIQFLSALYEITSGILSCKVILNLNSFSFSTFFTKSFSMVSPTYKHSGDCKIKKRAPLFLGKPHKICFLLITQQ